MGKFAGYFAQAFLLHFQADIFLGINLSMRNY